MTAGPDGSIWFTEGNYDTAFPRSIVRITPSGHFRTFTVFRPGVNGIPDQITLGSGHRLFFSVIDTSWDAPAPQHMIGTITTSGHVHLVPFRTQFDKDFLDHGVEPAGRLILQPHGVLWFADGAHYYSKAPPQIDRLTLPGRRGRGSR
jgi:hypothetical protein